MSDSTLPAGGTDRDLLLGVLALQLDFFTRDDFHSALHAWGDGRRGPLGEFLVEHNLLTPRRRALLEDVVCEYLAQHGMDVAQGLSAACAAREAPLDLDALATPAVRATLATLASAPPGTLRGSSSPNGAFPAPACPPSDRRFRVLRPHARGALGEVFLAHDEELNREVALKEIQSPYAHHPDSRARFLLEAEITGSLEHPGVVPVYSLGAYPDGRPFYAMRFIKGESLHDAITRFHLADTPDRDPSERALSLRALLTRFVAVCNAIDYAHSRGVIHRDIKPGNVMLGPYGETLVVDWGLAKAFNQPMTPDSTELPVHPTMSGSTAATMLGQAVGTPAFMPPEQAAGRVDQMKPASDIYSLGATLYNLLTGTYPYSGTGTEVLRQVKEGRFPPPRQVNRLVPAALDAVVRKAMAFHPDDRYASVHELAEEVERWLADEKVLAHRESPVGRGLRWMRHHRPYVYAAAALVLATLVGLLGVVWAVNQERKKTADERDNAKYNLALAKKAVDECFQLAKESPLLQQERMQDVRKLLLEKALPFYEQFSIQKPDDEALLFEKGRNYFRVGYITETIGRKDQAIKWYEQARAALAELLRRDGANDDYRLDLGRVTDNLGVLQRDTGRRQEALASLNQARELRQTLVDKHPESPLYLSDLALTCNNLGVLHRDRKEPREALACYEQALGIFRKLAKDRPGDDRLQADLAATLHNLGRLQAESEEPEEAGKAYEQAREIRLRLAKKQPEATRPRADLASTLLNLGALLSPRPDEAAKARAYFVEALALCEAIVKDRPEVPEYQWSLGLACTSLGAELWHGKEYPKAIALHERAVKILEGLVKQHDEEGEYRVTLAGATLNLGHALRDDGQVVQALACFGRAIAQAQELLKRAPEQPEGRDLLRKAHLGRAEALVKQRRYRDALGDFALALERTRPGDDDHVNIRALRASALAKAGDHGRAVQEVDDLLRAPGAKGDLLYNLACVCGLAAKSAQEAGEAKLAERYAVKAVELLLRAKLKGLFRDGAMVEHMKGDEDLASLRQREDYKRFLAELEAEHKKPGK